ncbi:uncharacterized protein LOC125946722 [Dermacentor silvarum]|uniref:uncharacterized protein LOC125946722 n=1 Tax=Dermacentor silvarum TaxID=543639 RepID=UPI0021018451|nr:uncharacterized protein LOC125946722 [Dermacentor silvarum]
MSQVPGFGKRIGNAQRLAIAGARKEFGMHVTYNEPFNAEAKDFRVEFKNKFVKDSKITIVLEVLTNKYMEICYEALEDSNKYFYVRQEPLDGKLYVGSKHLQYSNHHRYDLPLKRAVTVIRGRIYVIQLEWKSDDKIEFYLDGEAFLSSRPAGSILKDCARLVPGEEFVGDTTKKMRGFKVYEVHHTSYKKMTLTEPNHSYTLPAQYIVGFGGLIRFTGTCRMREKSTGEIKVYYGGQVAATLGGLQKDQEMMVVIHFHADRMAISLLGAPVPKSAIVISLTRSSADPMIKDIKVTRNLQTHTVEVYTGLSSAP